MGQQPRILPACRCSLVQPVLRIVTGQRFPHFITDAHDPLILHSDGSERDILQCLGNYTPRVERLLSEDYNGAYNRYCRTHRVVLPASADLIYRIH